MKIVVDYNEVEIANLKVVSAEYLGNFIIKIYFSDGVEKKVDFTQFLSKSKHPSTKKYMDEVNFAQFEIIDGNLNWNDYELIFPVWDLYKGKI